MRGNNFGIIQLKSPPTTLIYSCVVVGGARQRGCRDKCWWKSRTNWSDFQSKYNAFAYKNACEGKRYIRQSTYRNLLRGKTRRKVVLKNATNLYHHLTHGLKYLASAQIVGKTWMWRAVFQPWYIKWGRWLSSSSDVDMTVRLIPIERWELTRNYCTLYNSSS
jgi:hypothetical protein